jgi:hypothetical protein
MVTGGFVLRIMAELSRLYLILRVSIVALGGRAQGKGGLEFFGVGRAPGRVKCELRSGREVVAWGGYEKNSLII